MNNLNRKIFGMAVGLVISLIGGELLGPIRFRYFLGILLINMGFLFVGLCAYHYEECRLKDLELRKLNRRSKGK